MLTIDDAVNVCLRFLRDYSDVDPEEIRVLVEQEMEQRAWIARHGNIEPLERLHNLTFDINPAEISTQIESDNLRKWCETMQTNMRLAMINLPLK